jgi:hypothetical protein
MCLIGLPPEFNCANSFRVDVEPLDVEAVVRGGEHERNADVAEADDTDHMLAARDCGEAFRCERRKARRRGRVHRNSPMIDGQPP